MNHTTIKYTLLFFIIFSIFPFHLYSQESQINVLLFDFEMIGDGSKYIDLEKDLVKQLKNKINQSNKLNIVVERTDESKIYQEFDTSSQEKVGFLVDEDLKSLMDTIKVYYNYILMGRVWEKYGSITAEVRLMDCMMGNLAFSTQVEEGIDDDNKIPISDRLAEKILQNIELYFTGRVRIGIIDFKMTGGDSTFAFLEESIPTMLATSLSASKVFKLIETDSENLLKEIRLEGRHGIFDPATRLSVASKINANYLIMGEFWEYQFKLRIDARCVNIETGEIILSEGINLEDMNIHNISDKISELASEMRIVIEKDFIKTGQPLKSIAVVAFPPSPNNKRNRIKSSHIKKTFLRKLRLTSNLHVKDNPSMTKQYLKKKEDILKICTDLGVDYLLSFQYEAYEDQIIMMDVSLFDINRPSHELYTNIKTFRETYLNDFVDQVFDSLGSMNIISTEKLKLQGLRDIKVPTFSNRWTLGTRYAFIKRHASGENLYLAGGFGDYIELFLNYNINDDTQVEFQAGIDIGNRKEINGINYEVSSAQPGILFKYTILKTHTFDLYGGTGMIYFMVFRNGKQMNEKEHAGMSGSGLMPMFGMDFKIPQFNVSFCLETRYVVGTKIEKCVKEEYIFPGGKLGGLYLLGGIGYHFNL